MITSAEHVDDRQFYTQIIQEYEGRKSFHLSLWPSTSWALIGWCQMFTSTKLSSFPVDISKLLLVASLFRNWHSRMATFFFRLSVSSWIKRHSLKSDFNRILKKKRRLLCEVHPDLQENFHKLSCLHYLALDHSNVTLLVDSGGSNLCVFSSVISASSRWITSS